jgi:hypothetical protein
MKRWIAFITIITVSLGTFGCNMCCGPYDYDYANFGGKHPRVDPQYGRVGSIFSDPNAIRSRPDADSNLTPMTEQRKRTLNDDFDDGLDDNLESINPLDGAPEPPGTESLPTPPREDGTSPTASRLMKNRPLRPYQNWR